MKKILFISVLLLILTGSIFAEGLELGPFPVGKWADNTYDAVWEFNSNNIRILDNDGGVYYSFDGDNITDFKVGTEISGIYMSFYCEATGKTYKFLKKATDLNLDMTIDKDSGTHYEKTLELKR